MGYDSNIKIKKTEINTVEQLLLNDGFKKFTDSNDKSILSKYHKYIDDQCKYKEGTLFYLLKSKGNYSLCGRNWISCTSYDLKMHNDTLQLISSSLNNRDFYTDEGKNKFFETGKLTYGIENALYFSFECLHNKFEEMLFFIACIKPLNETQKGLIKNWGEMTVFNQESFSSNILSIYIVSILETYFKSTFINILKCLNSSQVNSIESKTNIPKFAKSMYSKGEIDNYQKIAAGYSFQNIKNIIDTYNSCFGINLNNVFNKRTNLNKTRYCILDEIFSIRHGNVHKLEFKYFTEKDFIKYMTVIIRTLNEIYHYLCKHYSVSRIESDLSHTSIKRNIEHIETNRKFNFQKL